MFFCYKDERGNEKKSTLSAVQSSRQQSQKTSPRGFCLRRPGPALYWLITVHFETFRTTFTRR